MAHPGCSLLLLGDVEVRRKRTFGPAQNTDGEDEDGGSPFVGEEEHPKNTAFREDSVYFS